MRTRNAVAGAAACLLVLGMSACGSDDESGGGGGGGGNAQATVKVGILGSVSGPNAASYPGFKLGAQARFDAYKADESAECSGLSFDLVEGDDATTEQGNLQASQKLVEQDQVFSILTDSTVLAASADYLSTTAADTPVIGYPLDGPSPQWSDPDSNYFKILDIPASDQTFSTLGEFFKQQGATKVAGVAFNIEPALVAMRATSASAQAAGLDTLEYGNIDFGTVDVSGAVNAIMGGGADAVWVALTPEPALQLVTALRQAGYDGIINLPVGYGGDLINNPNQVQASQGVIFSSATAPVELQSTATNTMLSALQAAGSEDEIPTAYEVTGYLSADLLIHGFEEAGCDATSSEWLETVRGTSDYDGSGLLPRPIDYSDPTLKEQCSWFLTLDGNAFKPLGDDPVCGTLVNG